MALKIIGSINGYYHARLVDTIKASTAGALEAGQGCYLTSNAWAKADTSKNLEGICIKGAAAGGTPIVELVKAGDIIEADYTGTAGAAFKIGLTTAVLDADGKNVNAGSTANNGHLRIISQDATGMKVEMVANKNFTTI